VPKARFGLTEVKWSIYPFGGAAIKLVQQIGHVHAHGSAADGTADRCRASGDARPGQTVCCRRSS